MFLKNWMQMGGFELNHHWHGIDILVVFECALLATIACLLLSVAGKFAKRSRLTILSLIGALSFATAAWAANTALSALSASGAIAGPNLFYVVQTAGVGGVKATATQVATFINSLFSGDITVTSGGVATLKNTGPGATGPVGSTTVIPQITIDAQGRVTALGSATAAGTVSSVTPGAGLVSGVTASCTQTAVTTTGTISSAHCVNAQTGTSYAIVDGDRAKLVTLSNASAVAVSIAQAGASSAFANGWYADVVNKGVGTVTITPATSTINGAATLVLTTAQGARVFSDGSNYQINQGAGTGGTFANPSATAGPTANNGVASTAMRSDATPAVQQGSASQKGIVQVDGTSLLASSGVISAAPLTVTTSVQSGTNYAIVTGDQAKVVYLSNASNQIPTIAQAGTTGFATGWFMSACNIAAGTQTITPATSTIGGASTYLLPPGSALSPRCVTILSDGTNYLVFPAGNTFTIASGTSALGTSAIGSAACATVVTTAGVGILTTDTVTASFNGDPTAVTGYVPLTAGMLTIIAYPTAGNVNFKVCNNTTSSITPGAVTLNWRVVR